MPEKHPFIFTPSITVENSDGIRPLPLADAMFARREVSLVGEIDTVSAYEIVCQLRELESQDAEAPITMFVNSPGGQVSSGLSIVTAMEELACPVRTVVTDVAAS